MQIPLLTDIYGDLLSERKRELLDYYYNEDYSLSEISEITGISRQGIRDSVKKSEVELCAFEEKLSLLKRMRLLEIKKAEIKELLSELKNEELSSNLQITLDKAISMLDSLGL